MSGYNIHEFDESGRICRQWARDADLEQVPVSSMPVRLEARHSDGNGHRLHWNGREWKPGPHPLRVINGVSSGDSLNIGADGRHRYREAVRRAWWLADRGITIARVDREGVTLVLHPACMRPDGPEAPDGSDWDGWCRARLVDAESIGNATRADRFGWDELERAAVPPDREAAALYAFVHEAASAFLASGWQGGARV